MPIYEYQCNACEHRLEALQKISADPLQDCPACGEPELKKLVSAASFRLKGGGWYETDFKTDKDKRKQLAESDSAADKSKNSTGDAGAKSESAADAKPKSESKASEKSAAAPAASESKSGSSAGKTNKD